jgi:hypothetical protein
VNKFLLRGLVILGQCLGQSALLFAHDPITTKLTWSQEISRLVFAHCASCHREGGSAMSLTTYAEARPWAKAIRDQVTSRKMPPWGAVPGIGDFKNDPSLTAPEIEMLVAWVEGGAPEGDPVYLPHNIRPAAPENTKTPRYSRSLAVSGALSLASSASVLAIVPKGLPDGGSLEAWAILPDRSVRRLIWLRDYQSKCGCQYVLREALLLPPGTSIRTSGGAANLLLR